MKMTPPLIRSIVQAALQEDIGSGDVTSAMFSGSGARAEAVFVAKQAGILSGVDIVGAVFRHLEARARVVDIRRDGETFVSGDTLLKVTASMHTLFSGERVALNFLQRLSGIATLTAQFVENLDDPGIGIYDTRKTTPLLRALEKRAVVHGGGRNHRFGLFDMAMLKNNHIDAAGGVTTAVDRLRKTGFFRRRLPLAIEARNPYEAADATASGADIVMLDNMSIPAIRKSVDAIRNAASEHRRSMPEVEVTGGITLQTIARYRGLPITRISVGALTHSAPAIDISMRYSS